MVAAVTVLVCGHTMTCCWLLFHFPGTPEPKSQQMFETVCNRLMDTKSLLPVQNSSVKHLAFDLVDQVLQHNFLIRDMFKGIARGMGARSRLCKPHRLHLEQNGSPHWKSPSTIRLHLFTPSTSSCWLNLLTCTSACLRTSHVHILIQYPWACQI